MRRSSTSGSDEVDIQEVRDSINIIRSSTSVTPVGKEEQDHANNEKRWRLSFMKQQFETLQLHKLFNRYKERINHGYFSQFLSLQIILTGTHFVLILSTNWLNLQDAIADLILYVFVVLFSSILLMITDIYVKTYPSLLTKFAISAFLITFIMNVFIPIYHRNDASMYIRPAYTTHLIIACYVFLNVHHKLIGIALGVFVSIFHLALLILITYRDENLDNLWRRLLSDGIFLGFINILGLYCRYMNEIVKRRSFLDRRSCIESTLQLDYEKKQEFELMSSIIPNHILEKFKSEIVKFWENFCEDSTHSFKMPSKEGPFEHPYVEVHENVTILFADIVNYTQMTSKYRDNITELLDILNELFSRFDAASEKLNVLRIKFLGDCYYCVSGLPPNPAPNNAEACVDLGLEMIEIIADVRKRRSLNIGMRIGIHTGTITSGVIGSIKWQYDIWSNDADTANKMESEGAEGRVHITETTRRLLTKRYDIGPKFKTVNNFDTFLISPTSDFYMNQRELLRLKSTESISENSTLRANRIYKKNDSRSSTSGGVLSNLIASQRNSQSLELIIDIPIKDQVELTKDDDDLSPNIRRDTFTMKRPPLIVNNGVKSRISGNNNLGAIHKRISQNARMSADGKRRTAFMNNNIRRYEERLKKTNDTLETTIESMLLSKFEQWFKVTDMNRIFLFFNNSKSELHFFTMPDPLFKYYIVNSLFLMFLVFLLQNLTSPSPYWRWDSWEFYLGLVTVTLIFVPLTWTHYLWTRHVSKYNIDAPRNIILRFFYNASKYVTNNVYARIVIYTMICFLLFGSVMIELIECRDSSSKSTEPQKFNFIQLVLRLGGGRSESGDHLIDCIVPWHMTETCALAIIMTFLFLRMYIWIKSIYSLVITVVYSYCVWHWSEKFMSGVETFNVHLEPKLAQILSVVFLMVILHLVDRQTEYMNRLDHRWYETLVLEQNKSQSVHTINKMLIRNILPTRVADLYLDTERRLSEDLFHEPYEDAAVMFASITNYTTEDMGEAFLKVMNKIICSFDMLSVGNAFGRPIEKIKVAKWTYMAASGLVPGFGNAENLRRDHVNYSVISLCKFAAAIMKAIKKINSDSFQDFKLRIGIASGPIVGGVVGSKKPLYDIWGDPVNMASRMDTCGLPDHIQVRENTAEIIRRSGYVCNYRDTIQVKGVTEKVRTYFVALDENYELVRQITDV